MILSDLQRICKDRVKFKNLPKYFITVDFTDTYHLPCKLSESETLGITGWARTGVYNTDKYYITFTLISGSKLKIQ